MEPVVFTIYFPYDGNIVWFLSFMAFFLALRSAWRFLPIVGG